MIFYLYKNNSEGLSEEVENKFIIEYCKYGYRHRIGGPALIIKTKNKTNNEITEESAFYYFNQKSLVPYFEKHLSFVCS
jgi:hypothetical protein